MFSSFFSISSISFHFFIPLFTWKIFSFSSLEMIRKDNDFMTKAKTIKARANATRHVSRLVRQGPQCHRE